MRVKLEADAAKRRSQRQPMRRICMFAGSSPGARPEYRAAALALGRTLASRGIGLVYGGARVGLMGAAADAALAAGGSVIGVIPETLVAKEIEKWIDRGGT